MLESNVGDLPNVTLHHAAVSRTAEPVIFYPSRSSWAGSTQPNDWTRSEDATEVPGQALDELLAGDVDLMKVDIEGGEFDILPASERLPSLRAVLGEIHAPPHSADAERLLALFEDFEVRSTEPDPAGGQFATVFSAVRAPQQAQPRRPAPDRRRPRAAPGAASEPVAEVGLNERSRGGIARRRDHRRRRHARAAGEEARGGRAAPHAQIRRRAAVRDQARAAGRRPVGERVQLLERLPAARRRCRAHR